MAVDGVNGGGNGIDDGALEKRRQGAGGQAQQTDYVGDPDAEGPEDEHLAADDRLRVLVAVREDGDLLVDGQGGAEPGGHP